jgi:hypothetical protein
MISDQEFTKLQKIAKSAILRDGIGYKVKRCSGGTTLDIRPALGGGTSTVYPWDIVSVVGVGTPDDDGKYSSYTAKVYPAMISGSMPGNMFTPITFGPDDTKYLTASITTDGMSVVSSTIALEDSPATPATPTLGRAPASLKVSLCVIAKLNYYNLWKRNITVQSREVLREDKPDPSAMELPYQSWWGWNIL